MARQLPWYSITFTNPQSTGGYKVRAKNKTDAIKRTCENLNCKSYDILTCSRIFEVAQAILDRSWDESKADPIGDIQRFINHKEEK